MKRIVAVIAVIFVVTLVGLGAWSLQNSHKTFEGAPQSITIGVPMMLDSSALIYVADDQHFFTDNGLNVTINVYDAGLFGVNDMLNYKNDFAIATEFVLVDKALQHENISTVGSIAKYQIHYLIGRRDRGIEKVSDLTGKKIGFASGTSGEFYLSRFLELHGINMTDITPVEVKPAQYTDAIVNGTVDAILEWDPHTDAIKERLGPNAIIWPAQSGQLGYWNVICRNDWAAQHPEQINRFLKAMDQAVKYNIYHPAEAKAIVQKRTLYDDAYIATTWSNTQFSLSLDESLITAMEDEGRWKIINNFTTEKNVPDFRNHIYLKGLDTIKPGSVNIIR